MSGLFDGINPNQDRITDEALNKLTDFFERLPNTWEVQRMQAYKVGVSVTVLLPNVDTPLDKAAAVDSLLHCASLIGPLIRNLRRERGMDPERYN